MRKLASIGATVLTSCLFVGCGSKVAETPIDDAGDAGCTTACDDAPPPPIDSGARPDSPSDVVIDAPLPPGAPTAKVDLLLVVDNSLSMGDKQLQLARHIPDLIKSLTAPDPASPSKAIADLHVAVITSSLGSHGTSACDPASTNPHNDDRGHLIPRADASEPTGWSVAADGAEPTSAACPAFVAASALTWAFDAGSSAMLTGVAGAQQLQLATSCVVESARQDGCGYEETLESMYHFLVDPSPYDKAEVSCTFGLSGDACGTNKIIRSGVDSTLLAERKAFLRDDSFLAVVILTDENDSSLKPAGLNWLPWAYAAGTMQRGWDSCASVPDDFEPELAADFTTLHETFHCYSCFENTANPNCALPWARGAAKLNGDADGRNLREFHQVQRFGYNFFWGRQRYVDAFTQSMVPTLDASGTVSMQPNPIFAAGRRGREDVLVVGVVGVPRGLVGDAVTGAPRAMTEADWAKIISPDLSVRDPHMIESIAPRAGIPRFSGDRSVDPVNGGDRDITDGDDLQYACIAPRASSTGGSYECDSPSAESQNPLCGPGKTQPYYKAYPGLRHLRVIHDLGAQGMVASICSPSLGPVMRAIVERMQPSLKAR